MEYSASGPFPVQALQEDLMPKELALLMVTQDELRCGMMTTLKCKLCPKVAFATRADFRRHCSQCEVHPDMLFSCDKCGDSFARDYARHRHSISNSKSTSQYGKCSTTTSEVIAEKRKAYHRILAGYDQDFRKWTEDGTPIGTSYAARVREEITNTSKWRTTTKEPGSSGGLRSKRGSESHDSRVAALWRWMRDVCLSHRVFFAGLPRAPLPAVRFLDSYPYTCTLA
ncbi:hypothetical protein BC834DRAFT_521599 [Gloeopeniophorella convolvens]|nr:hypothetical protein BC834DRAFT_521599 [Gloeopeniophorella convolvens]